MKLRSALLLLCALGVYAVSQPLMFPQEEEPVDSSQQIADKIVKSKKPVLVDFWAVWCGPCKMLNPILKDLEKEYKGKVEFMKVNVDVHRQISAYFGVRGIPAVFIINKSAVQETIVGYHPKEDYEQVLNRVLAVAKKGPTTTPPPAQQGKKREKSAVVKDTL
jgi:thioredoxin 1